MSRTGVISVVVSDEDKAIIQKRARQSGVTVAQYMRNLVDDDLKRAGVKTLLKDNSSQKPQKMRDE
jgi:hypothetical protein